MPIKLLTPAEYLAGKKDIVLRNGVALTQGVVNGKPPAIKTAAATAAVEIIASIICTDIEFAITEKLQFHEMMAGSYAESDDRANWSAALAGDVMTELEPVLTLIGKPATQIEFFSALHEAGRPFDVAKTLAEEVAAKMKPLPMHAGKWLSAIGVVQADLDKAAAALPAAEPPATKAEAEHQAKHPDKPLPPPAPAVPAYTVIEEDFLPPEDFAAMFGDTEIAGVAGAPPAMPPAPVPPAPAVSGSAEGAKSPLELAVPPPPAAPDKDAIGHAFELWYECGGGGLEDVAAGIGVSVGTMRNRCTGRTKGPISVKQAHFMRADTDRRIAALTEAAAIFAAVR